MTEQKLKLPKPRALKPGSGNATTPWSTWLLILAPVILIFWFKASSYQSESPEIRRHEDQAVLFRHDVGELKPAMERWQAGVRLASATPRLALSARIADLQAIRREAAAISLLNGCMNSIRGQLLGHMDQRISGFLYFMADDEEQSKQAIALSDASLASFTNRMTAECAK